MSNGPIRPLKTKNMYLKKQINFGFVKSHGFRGNLLCDFKEWECSYKNTHHIYLSISLSYSSDFGIKLVIRHSTLIHHQDNMSVKCIPPYTPLLYSKTGVYRGIHFFLIFSQKHRLWVLVRTASLRRF